MLVLIESIWSIENVLKQVDILNIGPVSQLFLCKDYIDMLIIS